MYPAAAWDRQLPVASSNGRILENPTVIATGTCWAGCGRPMEADALGHTYE